MSASQGKELHTNLLFSQLERQPYQDAGIPAYSTRMAAIHESDGLIRSKHSADTSSAMAVFEDNQAASAHQKPDIGAGRPMWHSFTPSNNNHRYLRKRTALLNAAFNTQPLTVSLHERRQAWHDLTSTAPSDGTTIEAPLVRSPFYVDYGTNVHVDPSAVVDRCCCFQSCPLTEAGIWVGEGTYVGVGVFIGTVKIEEDWRKRNGVFGPALAAEVRIGRDCVVGAGSIVLPGVTVGDGCVVEPGSVVTSSIPAYHVASGNPARPARRLALDVADARSLHNEMQDDRAALFRHSSLKEICAETHSVKPLAGSIASRSPERTPETESGSHAESDMQAPSPQALDQGASSVKGTNVARQARDSSLSYRLITALNSRQHKDAAPIVLDVLMLVFATLGGWLVLHSVLY